MISNRSHFFNGFFQWLLSMEFLTYNEYNIHLLIFTVLDVKCPTYAFAVKNMSAKSTIQIISIEQIVFTNCTFDFVLVCAIHRVQNGRNNRMEWCDSFSVRLTVRWGSLFHWLDCLVRFEVIERIVWRKRIFFKKLCRLKSEIFLIVFFKYEIRQALVYFAFNKSMLHKLHICKKTEFKNILLY